MTGQAPTPTVGGRLYHLQRRVQAYARFAMRSWRRSLRLRVALTTMVVGSLALMVLAVVLSDQVRDGLFEERRDHVLTDAAGRADQAQDQFDSATVSTPQDVQQLADTVVSSLQQTAVGIEGLLLLKSPDSNAPVLILAPVTDSELGDVITEDLREQVRAAQFQQWQSVSLIGSDGAAEPGIAVGSPVTLPLAGSYELYAVYSLATEQKNLELLQQVLGVGAVTLVVLLFAMTWYLTRQVLDPVRQAARTAERLADGRLTERMEVRGHDEFARLGRSFNEMAASLQDQIERLAALSHMQQRFVSDVSHELRTPLSTVRMAAELLYHARADFPPVQARSAELLQNQLDRFESLLVDLLEISRFDAGAAVLDVEAGDIRAVVEQVTGLAEPLAAERGSDLSVTMPDEPCLVDMDSRRVERVLRNLLINAVEHGDGQPIEVAVGAHENAVSVRVRDHGVGMTAPEAERVFDRFWRADPARTRTLGGTGLGLAIALEDARLHGGMLDAWGSPGAGATFRLTLPRRAGLTIGTPPLSLQPDRPAEDPPDIEGTGPAALPYLATPAYGQPIMNSEEDR